MSLALELRAVGKCFVAGTTHCCASVRALSEVSLTLQAGDAVCIVGETGAGKSTLLLCAAGLLVPDAGLIRWFGSRDRETALQRTTYHFAGAGSITSKRALATSPHIYLLDGGASPALTVNARVLRWIARRKLRGDVVVVSSRSTDTARQLGLRALLLRGGRIQSELNPSAPARVAERRASPIGGSS